MDTDQSSIVVNAIGFIFSLIFCPLLLVEINKLPINSNVPMFLAILYMIISLPFWLIQISYHFLLHIGKEAKLLQRIDRGSMLFLIAVLFTPGLVFFSVSPVGVIFSIILWVMASAGMGMILKIENLSRKLAPLLSFGMGILGIIIFLFSLSRIPIEGIIGFFLGTGFLIVAGIVYAFKKPDPIPEIYGFHELFHTLLLVGVIILHFFISLALL